jgi:glycosyltransferase involved in cell wall biosynthesis
VIGDGPDRLRLARLAASLGVADRVEWTGQLEPTRALEALASCHVMALPSHDEAFGVAYVEAMACGVPAVGSRGEWGPEEIASLGPGLVLVPPHDPEALAGAIDGLLEPGAWEEAGAGARRTAAEHFSWSACGRATVAAYHDAIASGR